MKGHRTAGALAAALLVIAVTSVVWATDAEMFFAADKNGTERVTEIREGTQVWIAVYDPDEDIDCDDRDKIWTEIKVVDAKTGAYIVWDSRNAAGVPGPPPHRGHSPGNTAGSLAFDYLEETGASTGLFTSSRPFRFGSRAVFGSNPRLHAHIVGPYQGAFGGAVVPTDFQWGGYLYSDLRPPAATGFGDNRVWVSPDPLVAPPFHYSMVDATVPATHVPPGAAFLPGDVPVVALFGIDYTLGRFENLDTIMGLYQDQNDDSDIAITLAKILDTRSSVFWDQDVYPDGNESATITVIDDDENLSCDAVESVPVFIIVNPGTWNPLDGARQSATTFCALKRYGGVMDTLVPAGVGPMAIDWFNAYDSGLGTFLPAVNLAADGSNQPNAAGSYYIQYPNALNTLVIPNVTTFDTASNSGVTRCMFYAVETGANTGVFELDLNSLLLDLGFASFAVGDVLVAYYVDPNDQDDFALATAAITDDLCRSETAFTDVNRDPMPVMWLGRDPIYLEVQDRNANVDSCCPEQVLVHICDPHEVDDAEWLILDETSSNSPIFFSNVGVELSTVWDALGVGLMGANGGYQLQLDNWRLEGFNEDVIYARYNDVTYTAAAMAGVGDLDTTPATGQFPPTILATRVEQDVSFALARIGDTQVVVDGVANMYFLDRQGNRVDHYANTDCLFVEVVDPDQNEDVHRRERIDGHWDRLLVGNERGQNTPFAPVNAAPGSYPTAPAPLTHPVNERLGFDNMFDLAPLGPAPSDLSNPKLYALNPRNGLWGAFDLLETEIGSGVFRSTICIDLVSQYLTVPTLGVLPGDTIVAFYQDPSNHSDNAWVAIKVSCGGGGAAPGTLSTTTFVNERGEPVETISDIDLVNVRVSDPSHAGAAELLGALTVGEETFDLVASPGGPDGTFIAYGLVLDLLAGETLIASYTDPSDSQDRSSDVIQVTSGVFNLEGFVIDPNPFREAVTFTFEGTGIPDTLQATVYDVGRRLVWTATGQFVTELVWDGTNRNGDRVSKGAYVYVLTATSEEESYTEKDVLVRY